MTKLIWHKTSKKFAGCYAGYYALSPVNNFVFVAKDQGGQWSNHIIYKKHLHLLNDIDFLNVEDLTFNNNRNQSLIDCACHTLRGSKQEFQRYVDNYKNHKKHSFTFYTLKDYVLTTRGKND